MNSYCKYVEFKWQWKRAMMNDIPSNSFVIIKYFIVDCQVACDVCFAW